MPNEKGFSITELLVVMLIFMVIMMITSNTFKTIADQISQQSKSLETQIEGIVGLEILRADLEQTGFGLPWTFQNTPSSALYKEADMGNNKPSNYDETGAAQSLWPSGLTPNSFNDAPSSPPRAIQSKDTVFNKGADNQGAKFLVIKSTVAATSDAAKKWTNRTYSNATWTTRVWNDASRDSDDSDRVIVVKDNLSATPPTRQLLVDSGTGNFFTPFSNYSTLIKPHLDGEIYQIYGVSTNDLRMPFNRADYYVARPKTLPAGCAPHTGVLYKANILHGTSSSAGGYDPVIPLLDCVADLQVVYGLDNDGSGRVNQYLDAPANTASPTSADIRNQLREIRVYVLTHDGKKDFTYTYPSSFINVGETLNGVFRGRVFDLATLIGSGWQNYRWKIYTIVVRPKNLIQ